MSEHTHDAPIQGVRRHTGAVELLISGVPPVPKSGAEILSIARAADFREEERFVHRYENGSVEYVPRDLSENALLELFFEGRLQYKFTIQGQPPAGWSLPAGTYYLYVNFVEGPDDSQGRWMGRTIDEEGEVVAITEGIEVKQMISFHLDAQQREEHGKPSIHVHGIGVGEVANAFRGTSWTVSSSDWVAAGNGCARLFTCTPPQ